MIPTSTLKNTIHVSVVTKPAAIVGWIAESLTGKSFAECGTLHTVHCKAWTHGILQGNYVGFIRYSINSVIQAFCRWAPFLHSRACTHR